MSNYGRSGFDSYPFMISRTRLVKIKVTNSCYSCNEKFGSGAILLRPSDRNSVYCPQHAKEFITNQIASLNTAISQLQAVNIELDKRKDEINEANDKSKLKLVADAL